MARNENKYVSLRLGWDKFIDKLSTKSINTKIIDSGWSDKKLELELYTLLTKNNFDTKGFKFVLDSVKIEHPNMTKKDFFKKYIYQRVNGEKINILDNIDNKATSIRMTKRLSRDMGVLEGRVKRLRMYKDNITLKSVDGSINDVKRIIDTNKTAERHIRNKLVDTNKVLKRKDLTFAEKRNLRRDIKELKRELKVTQKSNKILSKKYNKFVDSYTDMDESRLSKNYNKLLGDIESDIVNKQQKVVFDQALRSSASYQMKRVAQTEYVKSVTEGDVEKLLNKQDNSDKKLLVKYTLSPSHNIVDICDDHANKDSGYGKGVYLLDKAPIPVSDSHPNCKCELIYYGFEE